MWRRAKGDAGAEAPPLPCYRCQGRQQRERKKENGRAWLSGGGDRPVIGAVAPARLIAPKGRWIRTGIIAAGCGCWAVRHTKGNARFPFRTRYDAVEFKDLADSTKMPGDPAEDDDNLFRPVWETDDPEPPGPPRARKLPPEPDFHHPLLQPLARAQDTVARLEMAVALASPAVAQGLRARLSYREAAGWLAHAHVWIHPHDLALRDQAITNSYGAAFRAGRLAAEIPATAALEPGFESAPSDIMANEALRLARLWRRLSEMSTWRPLADTAAVHETLQSLGCRALPDPEIDDWFAVVDREPGPPLIRAGRAARDWMNRPGLEPHNPGGMFLAACLWCDRKPRRPIALPFWSASEAHHHRRELHTGVRWLAEFLDCAAAAAKIGLDELDLLRRAEEKCRSLSRTARSRLPDTVDTILRRPVVTARGLAETLAISPQAALGLLRQLIEAGIVREATGRGSWRAYVLS